MRPCAPIIPPGIDVAARGLIISCYIPIIRVLAIPASAVRYIWSVILL